MGLSGEQRFIGVRVVFMSHHHSGYLGLFKYFHDIPVYNGCLRSMRRSGILVGLVSI